MRTFIALALALILAAPLAAAPNSLPPPIVPDCLGVNIHFTGQPKQDLDGLVSGGFGWVRMDFFWSEVEKTKGVYDFSAYDSLPGGLTARHIRPLFILDYGNALYGPDSPDSPQMRTAFAEFAAAAAAHYRGKPIIWEIWNEPNGDFWKPAPNAAAYGALAVAAAHAIHVADPDATVIAPGMSGMDMAFLKSLCQQGLLPELDAVSFHPYRQSNPETAGADYASLRELLYQYAPNRVIPLVDSEWGYSTSGITEQEQAQYLVREWLYNMDQGIALSIWYDWHDDGTDPKNGEDNFGTVNNNYSPKPAFVAAKTLTHVLDGFRFIKRIPLASDDDYLLLFAHGPQMLKLAAWTTGSNHSLMLPIPHVQEMTTMLGDAASPSIAQNLLTLPLSRSPIYLDVQNDPALQEASAWSVTATDPFYKHYQSLKLQFTYRNPDSVSHRVRFEVVLKSPDGQASSIPGGSDLVGPGQTLKLGESTSAFAHVPVDARVGLRLDGVLQPYPQDVQFTPADPITLAFTKNKDGKESVSVTDMSSDAFSGHLYSTPGVQLAPVHLEKGQEHVLVPLPATTGQGLVLKDAEGRIAATLSPQTASPAD